MAAPSLASAKVVKLYGVSRESLLLYEAEGIISPLRVEGERYYTARDRVRIEIILKGKLLNFSLNEIKSLILAHLPEPQEMRGKAQIEGRIDQLEIDKLEIQAAIDRLSKKLKDDT